MLQFLLPFLDDKPGFQYLDYDYPIEGIPLVLSHCYSDLFEDLGFMDLPFEPKASATSQNTSSTHTLGWAVKIISERHVIFEVGDSNHHIRFDLKETWLGHRLAYQIDQVTLWDNEYIYDIPCAEGQNPIPLESALGTIDLAVQAIQNGDDEEGIGAFRDIADVKVILPRYPHNRLKVKSLIVKATP